MKCKIKTGAMSDSPRQGMSSKNKTIKEGMISIDELIMKVDCDLAMAKTELIYYSDYEELLGRKKALLEAKKIHDDEIADKCYECAGKDYQIMQLKTNCIPKSEIRKMIDKQIRDIAKGLSKKQKDIFREGVSMGFKGNKDVEEIKECNIAITGDEMVCLLEKYLKSDMFVSWFEEVMQKSAAIYLNKILEKLLAIQQDGIERSDIGDKQ